jgi:hypothetical protein
VLWPVLTKERLNSCSMAAPTWGVMGAALEASLLPLALFDGEDVAE